MTGESRRHNIAQELERSEQAFRAAQALLDAGLHADSVSRTYYAAFHVVRALLFSRGVEPRSHRAALHLLNVEFVRPGVLSSAWNRVIGGLQRARELADYDAAVTFSADDAASELAEARAFAAEAQALLRREGWLG